MADQAKRASVASAADAQHSVRGSGDGRSGPDGADGAASGASLTGPAPAAPVAWAAGNAANPMDMQMMMAMMMQMMQSQSEQLSLQRQLVVQLLAERKPRPQRRRGRGSPGASSSASSIRSRGSSRSSASSGGATAAGGGRREQPPAAGGELVATPHADGGALAMAPAAVAAPMAASALHDGSPGAAGWHDAEDADADATASTGALMQLRELAAPSPVATTGGAAAAAAATRTALVSAPAPAPAPVPVPAPAPAPVPVPVPVSTQQAAATLPAATWALRAAASTLPASALTRVTQHGPAASRAGKSSTSLPSGTSLLGMSADSILNGGKGATVGAGAAAAGATASAGDDAGVLREVVVLAQPVTAPVFTEFTKSAAPAVVKETLRAYTRYVAQVRAANASGQKQPLRPFALCVDAAVWADWVFRLEREDLLEPDVMDNRAHLGALVDYVHKRNLLGIPELPHIEVTKGPLAPTARIKQLEDLSDLLIKFIDLHDLITVPVLASNVGALTGNNLHDKVKKHVPINLWNYLELRMGHVCAGRVHEAQELWRAEGGSGRLPRVLQLALMMEYLYCALNNVTRRLCEPADRLALLQQAGPLGPEVPADDGGGAQRRQRGGGAPPGRQAAVAAVADAEPEADTMVAAVGASGGAGARGGRGGARGGRGGRGGGRGGAGAGAGAGTPRKCHLIGTKGGCTFSPCLYAATHSDPEVRKANAERERAREERERAKAPAVGGAGAGGSGGRATVAAVDAVDGPGGDEGEGEAEAATVAALAAGAPPKFHVPHEHAFYSSVGVTILDTGCETVSLVDEDRLLALPREDYVEITPRTTVLVSPLVSEAMTVMRAVKLRVRVAFDEYAADLSLPPARRELQGWVECLVVKGLSARGRMALLVGKNEFLLSGDGIFSRLQRAGIEGKVVLTKPPERKPLAKMIVAAVNAVGACMDTTAAVVMDEHQPAGGTSAAARPRARYPSPFTLNRHLTWCLTGAALAAAVTTPGLAASGPSGEVAEPSLMWTPPPCELYDSDPAVYSDAMDLTNDKLLGQVKQYEDPLSRLERASLNPDTTKLREVADGISLVSCYSKIGAGARGDRVTKRDRDRLAMCMWDNRVIFAPPDVPYPDYTATFTVKPGTVPSDVGPHYQIKRTWWELAKEKLLQLFGLGIVESTTSDWGHRMLAVPKRSATPSVRLVVSLEKLNAAVEDNVTWPTTNMAQVVESARGRKCFSTYDFYDAFNQLSLDPAVRPYTACRTGINEHHPVFGWLGHVQLTRLPQGFKRSVEMFTSALISCFRDYIEAGWLAIYVDDARTQAHSTAAEVDNIIAFLTRCRERGWKIKFDKLRLLEPDAKQLGMIIDGKSARIDPDRLQGLADFPQPNGRKELTQFIAMAGYYAAWVPDFASTVEPLRVMAARATVTARDWTPEARAAFAAVKAAVLNAAARAIPDPTRPFILHTDASSVGAGAVLSQRDDDGRELPVLFYSHRWNDVERRLNTTERECLAIVLAVRKCDVYLRLPGQHLLLTDHRNLQWMATSANDKVYRWACELLEYNMAVQHIPGRDNVVADCLSRVLPDVGIVAAVAAGGAGADAAAAPATPSAAALWEGKAASGQTATPWLAAVAAAQQHADDSEKARWRHDGYQPITDSGTQLWRHRRHGAIIIPSNATDMKATLLQSAHEHEGHGGVRSTRNRLQDAKVMWYGISGDVERHVATCPLCQRIKPSPRDLDVGTLTPRAAVGPWERVIIDHIGPLPESKNNNKYITVMVDPLTHYVELAAQPDCGGETTAETVHKHVIWRHGAPAEIQTDGATGFDGEHMRDLYDEYSVEHHVTIAYHPQSNGLAERKNRDIMNALRAYTGKNYSTWDEYLPRVQWHINTAINKSINMSPYQALHGHAPRTVTSATTGQATGITSLEALAAAIMRSQELALRNGRLAQQKAKAAYDAKRALVEYSVGEHVLVHRAERENKLAVTWQGPYVIKSKAGPNAYEVADVLLGNAVTVHVTRMRPFSMERTDADAEAVRMLPEGKHIVKQILKHKYVNDRLQVQVWWKGYPQGEATWQSVDELQGVSEYKKYCATNTLPPDGHKPVARRGRRAVGLE